MTRPARLAIAFALLTAGVLVSATARTFRRRRPSDRQGRNRRHVVEAARADPRVHPGLHGPQRDRRRRDAGRAPRQDRPLRAQGFRYKEENAPMQKDTIFSLMSMTKPIVSTALMMLWEEGRFMLDDPIANWLPSYADKQVMENGTLVKARAGHHPPCPDAHVGADAQRGSTAPSAENVLQPPGHCAGARGATSERPRRRRRPRRRHRRAARRRWPRRSSAPRRCRSISSRARSGSTVRPPISSPCWSRRCPGCRSISSCASASSSRSACVDTHYNIPKEKMARVAAVYRPGPDGKITLLRKPEFREPTTYFPGIAGLNGTAADYFRFCQMLLNGGEYNGQRLLGRMTVDLMFSNHIGTGKTVYVRGEGYGFGLGAGVLTDPAKSPDGLSIGTWSWGGADGTLFYIDPQEDLVAILMVQLNPYTRSQIRPKFSNVVSQAIIDSIADQKPRVMGYDTPAAER